MEHAMSLGGAPLKAFPDQNHDAHVRAHVEFFRSPFVQNNPAAMPAIFAHIQEHVGFMAREQAMGGVQQQIEQTQLAVQAGAVDPQEAQQQIAAVQQTMQNPVEVEAYVALLQAQILQKLMPELAPPQPDPMSDPLVQIRKAEVEAKQQENLMDAQIDAKKLELEEAKLQQKAMAEAARMELQEDIADDRNAVNRERIMMQAQMAQQRNRGA
jgi:hypothetical protein